MDKVKRFFELKELWKAADKSNRSQIDEEINNLLDSMNEDEIEQLELGVSTDLARINIEAKELSEILSLRQQMSNVLPMISASYLAKHYFGKSTSWFYQRLNGNEIHGKICRFTNEEIAILNNALKDMSRKIGNLSLE